MSIDSKEYFGLGLGRDFWITLKCSKSLSVVQNIGVTEGSHLEPSSVLFRGNSATNRSSWLALETL